MEDHDVGNVVAEFGDVNIVSFFPAGQSGVNAGLHAIESLE